MKCARAAELEFGEVGIVDGLGLRISCHCWDGDRGELCIHDKRHKACIWLDHRDCNIGFLFRPCKNGRVSWRSKHAVEVC